MVSSRRDLLVPNLKHRFYKSMIQISSTLGQSLNKSEMSLGANVYQFLDQGLGCVSGEVDLGYDG